MAEPGATKRLRYLTEYLLVRALFGLFGALPLDRASGLGGWLGRRIGPRLGLHRRAAANLAMAMPELDEGERARILDGMWEHLGRVFAEYPHLGAFDPYDADDDRLTVRNAEIVERLDGDGIGGIFFTAHIGNWELGLLGATRRGMTLGQMYRPANNPRVDRLIMAARAPVGGNYQPKSGRGLRNLMAMLKRGDHLAMMADQRYNEGIAVPFFGRNAMTAPAIAEMVLRYRVPLVPARIVRLDGARFRLDFEEPLALPDSGDREADVLAVMTAVNACFERWIREHPEQWLWVHRRWTK
ncbi:MAG: lauroyl acyltransferase [Alphaproteobacteria bacterium]|jgi:KDO2-lipid IV(A) lauroyltransferase|nr:lauroyl acyltransferase [Alphaproteobacteria bacterium]